jgi:hypothetical protein
MTGSQIPSSDLFFSKALKWDKGIKLHKGQHLKNTKQMLVMIYGK